MKTSTLRIATRRTTKRTRASTILCARGFRHAREPAFGVEERELLDEHVVSRRFFGEERAHEAGERRAIGGLFAHLATERLEDAAQARAVVADDARAQRARHDRAVEANDDVVDA